MPFNKSLRIIVDIAMTALLICAYAYQITGRTAHIWFGILTFVLFSIHIFINRSWFKTMFKGTYTPHRILTTVINTSLALLIIIMFITGIIEAWFSSFFIQFENIISIRQLHTSAAYWFLPLVGIHLGLHWGMFSKHIGSNRLIITIMRILAFLFVTFGVWSFFDRDMFAKLFLGFSFDYWPEERPGILFFVQTLSVMSIFVFIIYYFMKLKKYILERNYLK